MTQVFTHPRLDDHEFFTNHVDTSRPGLEGIPAAVERGDYTEARRLFASEVRATLQPQRFLRIDRSFLSPTHSLPGETLAEAAERILTLKLVSCSTPHQFEGKVDWFANPTYNQYREWTWQLSRHPDWAVLGQRYRETGDERYAEGFVKLFLSWVQQTAVEPLDSPSNATKAWRTIETGIRMGGSWQWALHSFYNSPHFTDDVLVTWYKSVWEHGWRLRNVHHSHNWLIMEQNGLGQIGILYPQFAEADEWKQFAFDVLVAELDNQVYPDGMQFELSTGYHQVNIRNYQWLWDVANACGETVPEAFRDGLARMHAANIKLMMPNGRLPDINDGGWHEVAVLMQQAAELYPERADFRWAATRGKAGTPPEETSIPLPYAGLFTMRSSWAPDALYAFFDGGPFGYAHQHEDKLNLLIHAYGRTLLTEAGNYAYDNSEMRRYVLSTRGHNTIRVDGEDQNRRLTFDRTLPAVLDQPAGASWHSDEQYDAVEAVYDEGYGSNAEIAVTHGRKVIFLKQGIGDTLGPCFLVVDRIVPQDGAAHEVEILWHLDTGAPDVLGTVVRSRDANQPNIAVAPAGVPNLDVQIVSGQEAPVWQGWRSIKHHQQGEYEPIPTAVYHWRISKPARLVTLLYPLRPDEAWIVDRVEADADPASTQIGLVLEDGERLELDETNFPVA